MATAMVSTPLSHRPTRKGNSKERGGVSGHGGPGPQTGSPRHKPMAYGTARKSEPLLSPRV
eukprot:6462255-Pyramimonas_sp.AAC.1